VKERNCALLEPVLKSLLASRSGIQATASTPGGHLQGSRPLQVSHLEGRNSITDRPASLANAFG